MPIIKSAKKRMRQSIKRRERNYPVRSKLKTLFKKELEFIKNGDLENAEKNLAMTYSVIDTACKKNIIHKNNAARKKSRLALALNELKNKGGKKTTTDVKKTQTKNEKKVKKA